MRHRRSPSRPAPSERVSRHTRLTIVGALLAAFAACARPAPTPPATAFAAPSASLPAAVAPYAAVHVDHLQDGTLGRFTEARRRWLSVLSRASTTDGRGLFLQTGDTGFLSMRPLHALGDLDRQPEKARAALAGVDPKDLAAYDAASDALLAPPHRTEIWQYDPSLSYGARDPVASLAGAAWGKMTVEEIDPSPAGADYAKAWAEIRDALTSQSYPLVRVAYWSRYGTGNLVTFWLARSQAEFLETRSVEATVAAALGDEQAATLVARQRRTMRASDSIDVIPRLDLSSKPF